MSAHDYVFKIVLVGNSCVGKSSIMTQEVKQTFTTTYLSTIGVDFMVKHYDVGWKKAKVQIWDTAGQERFRTIISNYYRGANAVIICYDLSNDISYKDARIWLGEVRQHNNTARVYMAGNKSDISDFSTEQNIERFETGPYKEYDHFITSAKTGKGVNNMFNTVVSELVQDCVDNNVQANYGTTILYDSGNRRGCC